MLLIASARPSSAVPDIFGQFVRQAEGENHNALSPIVFELRDGGLLQCPTPRRQGEHNFLKLPSTNWHKTAGEQ